MQALCFYPPSMTAGEAQRKPDGADAYPAYMPGEKIKPPRNFHTSLQAGGGGKL
ncbi:hypothetical protein KCP76_08085 [Salmonella enterica subsp. enterica serovar Weltevreden]|nr:hypothetical protein KCP76_08085 [Salmonella enterica subsp. enterica serovar Weltevreden]